MSSMMTTMTQPKATKRSRPWLVSCAGGKVLGSFKYPDRAHDRAQEILGLGVARSVWVHNRWTGRYWRRDAAP